MCKGTVSSPRNNGCFHKFDAQSDMQIPVKNNKVLEKAVKTPRKTNKMPSILYKICHTQTFLHIKK